MSVIFLDNIQGIFYIGFASYTTSYSILPPHQKMPGYFQEVTWAGYRSRLQ